MRNLAENAALTELTNLMPLVGKVYAFRSADALRDEIEDVCGFPLADQRLFWELDEGLAHDSNELELLL